MSCTGGDKMKAEIFLFEKIRECPQLLFEQFFFCFCVFVFFLSLKFHQNVGASIQCLQPTYSSARREIGKGCRAAEVLLISTFHIEWNHFLNANCLFIYKIYLSLCHIKQDFTLFLWIVINFFEFVKITKLNIVIPCI